MARLNHPAKRLSFLLFTCSALVFLGLAALPTPFKVSNYPEWRDAPQAQAPDRRVVRINTACAGSRVGSTETFARDFFIVDSYTNENPFASALTKMTIEQGGPFTIAGYVDLTDKETAGFFSKLSNSKKLCLKDACIEKLDVSLLTAIIASCSKSIGQQRNRIPTFDWLIVDNLQNTYPWSLAALFSSIIFLMGSVLYSSTLGPISNWIRTGSWSKK